MEQEGKVNAEEKTLIVCVGLPRSGKSTWARAQPYPMVNPDSIRLALHGQRFVSQAEPHVWAIAKTMVRALFLAGHPTVILDATNTTRERRREWQSRDWETFFRIFPTPLEECLQRAQGDEELIEVIRRMAANYEPPGPEDSIW